MMDEQKNTKKNTENGAKGVMGNVILIFFVSVIVVLGVSIVVRLDEKNKVRKAIATGQVEKPEIKQMLLTPNK